MSRHESPEITTLSKLNGISTESTKSENRAPLCAPYNSVVSSPIWTIDGSNDPHVSCGFQETLSVVTRLDTSLNHSQTPTRILNREAPARSRRDVRAECGRDLGAPIGRQNVDLLHRGGVQPRPNPSPAIRISEAGARGLSLSFSQSPRGGHEPLFAEHTLSIHQKSQFWGQKSHGFFKRDQTSEKVRGALMMKVAPIRLRSDSFVP